MGEPEPPSWINERALLGPAGARIGPQPQQQLTTAHDLGTDPRDLENLISSSQTIKVRWNFSTGF